MKKLIWNIKNIIRWIPVLWNNWDWDYGFLYSIMLNKLNNMYDFFMSSSAMIADAQETAEQIKYIIDRLDRLANYSHAEYLTDADFNWESATEEEIEKIFKDANVLEEKDHQEIFDFMRDNIRGWWD